VDHFRWKLHVYLAYSIDASKCAIGKTQRKRCVAASAILSTRTVGDFIFRLNSVVDTKRARGPCPQKPIVFMASKWDILAPKKNSSFNNRACACCFYRRPME